MGCTNVEDKSPGTKEDDCPFNTAHDKLKVLFFFGLFSTECAGSNSGLSKHHVKAKTHKWHGTTTD